MDNVLQNAFRFLCLSKPGVEDGSTSEPLEQTAPSPGGADQLQNTDFFSFLFFLSSGIGLFLFCIYKIHGIPYEVRSMSRINNGADINEILSILIPAVGQTCIYLDLGVSAASNDVCEEDVWNGEVLISVPGGRLYTCKY